MKKKRYNTKLARFTLLLFLAFPFAEIAARIIGHRPYYVKSYTIESSPKNCLVGDSIFGIALNPGEFDVTINGQLKYHATHLSEGQRLVDSTNKSTQLVYLLGCSFTYGMGVDNHETFAARIQNELPDLKVVNLGVPGHGTVQAYLQLERAVKDGNVPRMMVLNFSYLHFDRNALTPSYRRDLLMGYARSEKAANSLMQRARFPYFDDNKIKSVNWEDIYQNWPGRETFAVINLLNSLSDRKKTEAINTEAITRELFGRLSQLCKENNIRFVVSFLDQDPRVSRLSAWCSKEKIDHFNVGWNHFDAQYTNLPHDNHPNADGHQLIAKKISQWVKEGL